jgi:hypothetical protein
MNHRRNAVALASHIITYQTIEGPNGTPGCTENLTQIRNYLKVMDRPRTNSAAVVFRQHVGRCEWVFSEETESRWPELQKRSKAYPG